MKGIRRNVSHSDFIMKDRIITCIHRFNKGETKNQCELIGSSCNNGLWSEQTCGITIFINDLQKTLGIKK